MWVIMVMLLAGFNGLRAIAPVNNFWPGYVDDGNGAH